MFKRQLPTELRGRETSLAPWTDHDIALEDVRAVLHAVAQAFGWDSADAWRLRPGDKLWSIYHSYYPQEHWWQRLTPDELEIESLLRDLKRRAPAARVIDLHPEITILELVRHVAC